MEYKKEMSGPWACLFDGYMAFRIACGLKVSKGDVYKLATLCDYLASAGAEPGLLTEEVATGYLRIHEGKSASTIRGYECMLRRFASYLRAKGHDAWVLPVTALTRQSGQFVPYVFTAEEVRAVFSACDEMRASGPGSRNRLFYQALFRLLYSTGMRVGEALSLGMRDVDLDCDVITVNDGKGGVSRLVPFRESLHPWLEGWSGSKARRARGGDLFFESSFGGAVSSSCVLRRFTEVVLPAAGITPAPGQKINVHSIRHTFACHALDALARSGEDLQAALPYLATYLGHKDVKSTELYLRLTEDRFDGIVSACHHIYDGMQEAPYA